MRYTQKLDKRSRWLTAIYLLMIVAFGVWIYLRAESSFLPAWLTILFLAFAVLMSLSLPRYIELTPSAIEVRCWVELTHIRYENIRKLKIVERGQMKWLIPLVGVYGFLGYYGYYLNLKTFELIRVNARKRTGYVLVENIYEQKLLLGVDDPEDFVREVDKIQKKLL